MRSPLAFACVFVVACSPPPVEPLQRLDVAVATQSRWRNTECDFWDNLAGVSIPAPP